MRHFDEIGRVDQGPRRGFFAPILARFGVEWSALGYCENAGLSAVTLDAGYLLDAALVA